MVEQVEKTSLFTLGIDAVLPVFFSTALLALAERPQRAICLEARCGRV
jgi:hypothetical protein